MPDAPKKTVRKSAAKVKPSIRKAPKKQPDTLLRRRSGALSLLQIASQWVPFYGPTGVVLWRLPSEPNAGVNKPRRAASVYTVYVAPGGGPTSCTCPDATYPAAGRPVGPCKHVLAVKSYLRAVKSYTRHMAALVAATGGSSGKH